ncbi:MAG: type II toxin-antitoxin system VapC family toxin [bacterium]|nr:type II toxin-antitoxin system VapC family toxin [bacterium]
MAVEHPVFFDTSVLLGSLIELDPANNAAQQLLAAIADGWLSDVQTAWHCCLEFYSVSTRLPKELRLEAADALLLIEKEILARFEVHALPEDNRETFFQASMTDKSPN